MTTRRMFLRHAMIGSLYSSLIASQKSSLMANVTPSTTMHSWRMPDEGEPHDRTWMSFGASRRVWGRRLLERVRKDLAAVAETIAIYEPVTLCVRPGEQELAASYFEDLTNIDFLEMPLNDLWIRDYGALFVLDDQGGKAANDFNFNGWGKKQAWKQDAQVAGRMADAVKVPLFHPKICLEGGGVEVDGLGTAILTESCILNQNRNPGWTRKQCEQALRESLGIEKVIWLPGVKNADITDGHTDFYARFAGPQTVVAHLDNDRSSPEYALTRKHLEILESAEDCQGKRLRVETLAAPTRVRPQFETEEFCAGYINFYVCNEAVLCPQFGDSKADGAAHELLSELFQDREIEMCNIDGIAAGGGGIHCATQQEPRAVRG